MATLYIRRQAGQQLRTNLSLPFTIEGRSERDAIEGRNILNALCGEKTCIRQPGDIDGRWLIDGSMSFQRARRAFPDCPMPLTVEGLFKIDLQTKERVQ